MKTAIVYDRVNKWGGAERVLLALHEIFPEAPLYTSVYSPKGASWAKVFPSIIPSFLQNIPGADSNHEMLAPLMPIAFERFNLDGFDVVISVTSEAAKGIITKPGTLHICYCLTPTRYLWSHYDQYFRTPLKLLSRPVVNYLRTWDKVAASRPDKYIAISNAVKKRIKKYYKRDSEIIYPPVNVNKLKIKNLKSKKKDYYLIVSRLVPYKKVDLAINAFNKLGLPLMIVGTGSEEEKLKSIAKNNINFAGFAKEEDLPDYYQNAKAFIYPHEEDFGITAVEAQSAGVPVIAYKAGGALDTVVTGKTGLFFSKQTEESLLDAIKRFEKIENKFKPRDCSNNARRFSLNRFKKKFSNLVK